MQHLVAVLFVIVGAFVLGTLLSKNLRRWLIKFGADPVKTINDEIAELKALADKYRPKPPPPPAP